MHCLRTCVRADVCQWFRLCMSVCAGGGGGEKTDRAVQLGQMRQTARRVLACQGHLDGFQ